MYVSSPKLFSIILPQTCWLFLSVSKRSKDYRLLRAVQDCNGMSTVIIKGTSWYTTVGNPVLPAHLQIFLSWAVAVAIAVVIPFMSYKWGPNFKKKVDTAMKITEDVVEAVEKVAEEVEKVAEDIVDDLPEGGKLRRAVDFVEKLAERTAKDAGAIDEFIDKVQEEEEKAELFIESLKHKPEKPKEELKNETKIKVEGPKQND
ncbi:hypothetical protein OROMI_030609 [Orobanche minor]